MYAYIFHMQALLVVAPTLCSWLTPYPYDAIGNTLDYETATNAPQWPRWGNAHVMGTHPPNSENQHLSRLLVMAILFVTAFGVICCLSSAPFVALFRRVRRSNARRQRQSTVTRLERRCPLAGPNHLCLPSPPVSFSPAGGASKPSSG